MKKTILAMSMAASSVLFAGSAFIPVPTQAEVIPVVENEYNKFSVFAGAGLGSSNINDGAVSFKDGDEDNTLLNVGVGYRLAERVFVEIEYISSDNDYTDSDFLLGSINYDFYKNENLSLYVGALAGGQSLEWSKNPIVDSDPATEDKDADRFVYGGQIGISVGVAEDVFLYGKYQYITGDNLHTDINTKTLKEEDQNNFILGVSYEF